MYNKTITLFNYHKATGNWFLSVIPNVSFINSDSSAASKDGLNNTGILRLSIHSTKDKQVHTLDGLKSYTGTKSYAKSETPSRVLTFAPETDFIYDGVWSDLSPISDDEYDSGLYHEMNNSYDGVYLVQSVTFYELIPHFEIGGR